MAVKNNQKKLRGEGGFWETPILGPLMNVLYSAASDVAGVSGQAASDVIETAAKPISYTPTPLGLGASAYQSMAGGEGMIPSLAMAALYKFPFAKIAEKPAKYFTKYKKIQADDLHKIANMEKQDRAKYFKDNKFSVNEKKYFEDELKLYRKVSKAPSKQTKKVQGLQDELSMKDLELQSLKSKAGGMFKDPQRTSVGSRFWDFLREQSYNPIGATLRGKDWVSDAYRARRSMLPGGIQYDPSLFKSSRVPFKGSEAGWSMRDFSPFTQGNRSLLTSLALLGGEARQAAVHGPQSLYDYSELSPFADIPTSPFAGAIQMPGLKWLTQDIFGLGGKGTSYSDKNIERYLNKKKAKGEIVSVKEDKVRIKDSKKPSKEDKTLFKNSLRFYKSNNPVIQDSLLNNIPELFEYMLDNDELIKEFMQGE